MFHAERDTYRYHLIQKGRIVHRDITYDLTRREAEHQKTYPASHIRQIGRKTTRKAALKWQRQANRHHDKEPRIVWGMRIAAFLLAVAGWALLLSHWIAGVW